MAGILKVDRVQSDSNLAFQVAGANVAYFNATGLNVTGGEIIAGGSTLRATSGLIYANTGISFPATQSSSSDANTLDDYEEGTWTPALNFSGGSVGITYSDQVGRYTKIGRLVSFNMYMRITSKGTSTGSLQINGLPFTSAATGNGYNTHTLWINSTTSSLAGVIQGYVAAGVTHITWERFNSGFYGTLTQVTNSDVGGSGTDFMCGGFYYTS